MLKLDVTADVAKATEYLSDVAATPPVSTVSSREPQAPLETRATAPDYQTSRAIREAYAARLAKLEFEERTGKLISSDEVKVAAPPAVTPSYF